MKSDFISRVIIELGKFKDNGRMLVLITHGFLELLVNSVIDARCKNAKRITDDNRSYPHSVKLILLNEIGEIEDRMYQLLDAFRKLRNKAAHESLFTVEAGDMVTYRKRLHDPHDPYELCLSILASFWNDHVELLGPTFAPSLFNHGLQASDPPRP